MSINLSPLGGAGWQFFDNNGVPLSGGLLYTYLAGTTTPVATYTSASGSIANSNPIVLDSSGRPPNEIWLIGGTSYKFVLQYLPDFFQLISEILFPMVHLLILQKLKAISYFLKPHLLLPNLLDQA